MEEVTAGLRTPVLAAAFLPFFFSSSSTAYAQRPAERYKALLQRGVLEPRVRSFVFACLKTASLPRPVQFYSQGAWFVTTDLAAHVKLEGNNDDGTAQVWALAGKPRAVSMWVHDDEFDRNTLACLADDGAATRQVNEYMPGLSEPDLHWIYIHTFLSVAGGKYKASGRYADWDGRPIAAPKLTSEDRDFIAGERQYKQWKDFDFASALERSAKP